MAVKKVFFKKDSDVKIESSERREDCETCGLCESAFHPKLSFAGEGKKSIAIVGEFPSADEEEKGDYFYGRDFRFLRDALEELGVDIARDCYYLSAVSCRTPRNRPPTKMEVTACGPRIDRFLSKLKPSVIICLGKAAFDTIVAPRVTGRLKGTGYNKFYGDLIPDQQIGCYILPTYSVKELMDRRTYEDGNQGKPLWERDKAIFREWKEHLARACSVWDQKVEIVNYTQQCKITQDIDVAIDWIIEAMDWDKVAFDYETTGIKPHRKGHRIVTASISNGKISYAFPFFDDPMFRKTWKRLMRSPNKKIAHNIGFEYLWTNEICGYWFENLFWDTMLAAHILHNQKPTGLKYCTYAEFGVIGYDDAADPYLGAPTKDVLVYGENAFNRIDQVPMADLLLYNALDSLFTYRLYEKQLGKFDDFIMKGMDFFMESVQYLTKTTQNGCVLDTEQFALITKELEEKIAEAERLVMESDEVKLWDREKEFNFNSGPQLSHLLYDIMKLKPVKYTETGAPSVDVEALEKIDLPLIKRILTYRKLSKLLGTYINQYSVETVDGIIHPWFYLNKVDSYRSSCGAVNIQNLPKRDETAKRMITSLIKPRPGHKIISYDFKSLEVMINACHSGDKNLVIYTSDPTKDMHRDSAADIFMLDPDKVPKGVRGSVKGAFVFAEFYGSYYKQTAPDCWEIAKEFGLVEHLASKGITTYEQFEKRVEHAEEVLWGERFKTHDEWRKEEWRKYQRDGHLETKTGFRLRGPMSRNNSFNGSVQGDAYHVMQWAFNQVYRELEERGMDSRPWAEIHDAADFDVNPAEEALLDYLVWYYFTQAVREHWPWIVVNLQVEKEAGEVDGNWATLKGAGYLTEESVGANKYKGVS